MKYIFMQWIDPVSLGVVCFQEEHQEAGSEEPQQQQPVLSREPRERGPGVTVRVPRERGQVSASPCGLCPHKCKLVLPVPQLRHPLLFRDGTYCSLKAVDLLGDAFPPRLTMCSFCVGSTASSPHPKSRSGSRDLCSG